MKDKGKAFFLTSSFILAPSSLLSCLCAFVFLSLIGQSVLAQSGRRGQRQNDTPARSSSSSVKTDSASAPADNGAAAARLSLFVTDRYESSNVPSNVAREVFNSFTQRLHERSSDISVKTERDISRKQAAERAKTEKQAYVVWLGMQPDTPDSPETANSDYLVLNFVVFSPGSAEVKIEGRIYYRQADARALDAASKSRQRKRRVVRSPAEETLEGVGRAAADRVIAAFKDLLPS